MSNSNNYVITDKDSELILLFKRWNYLTLDELIFLIGKSETALRWRINRLVEVGLLHKKKEVIGKYVYFLNYKKFKFSYYEHERACKYLASYLSKKNNCQYLTSKEIKGRLIAKKGVKFLGAKVPDLILVKDGNQIAIEAEITQKTEKRQISNIKKYMDDLSFNEYLQVVYYCGSLSIKDRLDNVISNLNTSGIKTALLKEVCYE